MSPLFLSTFYNDPPPHPTSHSNSQLLASLRSAFQIPMDWYSWLSKSGLEPWLVYDYSVLFTHNELEEEDIVHFNHDFLLSMGISIAKHRLEILKLAKALQKRRPPMPISMLLVAVKKTRNRIKRYLGNLVIGKEASSAMVVVPKGDGNGGARWKGAMMRRDRRMVLLKQERLMITDGGGVKVKEITHGEGHGSTHRSSAVGEFLGSEEIRWDSMFQNLKPT